MTNREISALEAELGYRQRCMGMDAGQEERFSTHDVDGGSRLPQNKGDRFKVRGVVYIATRTPAVSGNIIYAVKVPDVKNGQDAEPCPKCGKAHDAACAIDFKPFTGLVEK